MDKMTREQRHRCMSAIRSRNTKPEMIVRRYLFAQGFRYRLNSPRLPGHPDMVLRKYRTVVFVNGCFWHSHEGCKYYRMPKTNVDFWQATLERNDRRDEAERQTLARMGWHCITVWECQLRPQERDDTLASIKHTLNHIFLQDRSQPYTPNEEEYSVAAEAESPSYGH